MKRKNIIISFIAFIVCIGVLIIIYLFKFHGGLSDNQEDWASFGNYFGGVLATIIGVTSLIVAIYALYRTTKKERFNAFYNFTNDYRSIQMSKDIKKLWKFYNQIKGTDEEKEVELIKNYEIAHNDENEIYFARRNISHFYMNLSLYIQYNDFDEKLIFTIWNTDTLKIIKKILMPCEKYISQITKNNQKLEPFEYLIRECELFEQKNI